MTGEVVVGKRFVIQKKIGCGSFGEIYSAIDRRTGEQLAAKAERADSKHPQLRFENKVYTTMPRDVGFPEVFWFGESGRCNVMVMELLGPSLETLFATCRRKFTLKTVAMLALQVIDRLRHLHENHYVHRDVKPDNFLIGKKAKGAHKTVFVIDFGLCKRYRDGKTHAHIPYRDKKRLTGTPRYASIFTHQGSEQSRRDDLESLGYILVYFCRGQLPWMGLKGATKQEKYDAIGKKKMSTPVNELCSGLPGEFEAYLNYCRGLKFEEKPNYEYLKSLFMDVLTNLGTSNDGDFDWESKKSRSPSSAAESSHRTTSKRYVSHAIKPPMSRRRATTGNVASGGKSKSTHVTPTPANLSSSRGPPAVERKQSAHTRTGASSLQQHHMSSTTPPIPSHPAPTNPNKKSASQKQKLSSSGGPYHSPVHARKSRSPSRGGGGGGGGKGANGKANMTRPRRAGTSPAISAAAKKRAASQAPEIIDISSDHLASHARGPSNPKSPLREKTNNLHHNASAKHIAGSRLNNSDAIPVGAPADSRPATAPGTRSPSTVGVGKGSASSASKDQPRNLSDYLKQKDRRMKRKARQRSMTAAQARPASRVVPTAPVPLKAKGGASSPAHSRTKGGSVAPDSSPSMKDLPRPRTHPRDAITSPALHAHKKGRVLSASNATTATGTSSMHVLTGAASSVATTPAKSTKLSTKPRTRPSTTAALARASTTTVGTTSVHSKATANPSVRPSSGRSNLTACTSVMTGQTTGMATTGASNTPNPSRSRQLVDTVPMDIAKPSDDRSSRSTTPTLMQATTTERETTGTTQRGTTDRTARHTVNTTMTTERETTNRTANSLQLQQKRGSGWSSSGGSIIGVKRSRTTCTQTDAKENAMTDDAPTQDMGREERDKLMNAYETMELERDRWKRHYETISRKFDASQAEVARLQKELEFHRAQHAQLQKRYDHDRQGDSSKGHRRPLSAATALPSHRHHLQASYSHRRALEHEPPQLKRRDRSRSSGAASRRSASSNDSRRSSHARHHSHPMAYSHHPPTSEYPPSFHPHHQQAPPPYSSTSHTHHHSHHQRSSSTGSVPIPGPQRSSTHHSNAYPSSQYPPQNRMLLSPTLRGAAAATPTSSGSQTMPLAKRPRVTMDGQYGHGHAAGGAGARHQEMHVPPASAHAGVTSSAGYGYAHQQHSSAYPAHPAHHNHHHHASHAGGGRRNSLSHNQLHASDRVSLSSAKENLSLPLRNAVNRSPSRKASSSRHGAGAVGSPSKYHSQHSHHSHHGGGGARKQPSSRASATASPSSYHRRRAMTHHRDISV